MTGLERMPMLNQDGSDMLHLILLSGRRLTAQKSITSYIVLKYPRSEHLIFTELYDRINNSVPDQSFVMEKYRIPARTIHVLANNEPHTLHSYDGDEIYFLQVKKLQLHGN